MNYSLRSIGPVFFAAIFAAIHSFDSDPLFAGSNSRITRHAGLADFSQGTFGDSGRNIYISAAGHIQMIHRWDLNRDGFVDLVFTEDENSRSQTPDALVYLNERGSFGFPWLTGSSRPAIESSDCPRWERGKAAWPI